MKEAAEMVRLSRNRTNKDKDQAKILTTKAPTTTLSGPLLCP